MINFKPSRDSLGVLKLSYLANTLVPLNELMLADGNFSVLINSLNLIKQMILQGNPVTFDQAALLCINYKDIFMHRPLLCFCQLKDN